MSNEAFGLKFGCVFGAHVIVGTAAMLVARAFGVVCFSSKPNVKSLRGVFVRSRSRRTKLNTDVKRRERIGACIGGRIRCYLDCVAAAAWTEEAREAHCCNGGPCYLRTGFSP